MAIGAYKSGAPIGILLGSLIGRYVAVRFGWCSTLLIAGLPGCMLALVVWRTLQDPGRDDFDAKCRHKAGDAAKAAAETLVRTPGAVALVAGIVTIISACAGFSAFAVGFLQRFHGFSLAGADTHCAIASALGTCTTLVLGAIADGLTRNGLHRSLGFSGGSSVLILVARVVMLLATASFV